MFYVKKARIQLKEGYSFTVNHKDAQRIFQSEIDDVDRVIYQTEDGTQEIGETKDLMISDFDRKIHSDLIGPVAIPRHSVLYIAFTEDQEANGYVKQIRDKWDEITKITGVKDDGGTDWFTIGDSTYIGSEEWKASDDPHVANLVREIEQLEDQLDAYLKAVETGVSA